MDGRLVMETWMDGQMYGRQMDSNLRFCLTGRVLRRFVQLPVPRLQAHLGVWMLFKDSRRNHHLYTH